MLRDSNYNLPMMEDAIIPKEEAPWSPNEVREFCFGFCLLFYTALSSFEDLRSPYSFTATLYFTQLFSERERV